MWTMDTIKQITVAYKGHQLELLTVFLIATIPTVGGEVTHTVLRQACSLVTGKLSSKAGHSTHTQTHRDTPQTKGQQAQGPWQPSHWLDWNRNTHSFTPLFHKTRFGFKNVFN